jgi:hypothetical protein
VIYLTLQQDADLRLGFQPHLVKTRLAKEGKVEPGRGSVARRIDFIAWFRSSRGGRGAFSFGHGSHVAPPNAWEGAAISERARFDRA